MRTSPAFWTICLTTAVFALSACSSKDTPELLNLRQTGTGPDEFSMIPNKGLQAPDDLTALPAPTPGGGNLADPTPKADAVAALGGNPAALTGGGVDGGIVNYAARYGLAGDIRLTLAEEDLEYRRQNDGRLLERLFNVNVYFKAYRPMSLDQYLELERFRRAGVRTPAVPPDPVE